jgi:hypothetical protein
VFVQVLRLCAEAGLVRLGLVAVDGTKIDADASSYLNYDLAGGTSQRGTVEGSHIREVG